MLSRKWNFYHILAESLFRTGTEISRPPGGCDPEGPLEILNSQNFSLTGLDGRGQGRHFFQGYDLC